MVQKQRGERADGKAVTRRRNILRAAARVFRERGIAATGMRDIAAEAGLTAGNLYYYFKNKAELVYFCQAQALDRMLAAALATADSAEPAAERLRQVIAAHLDATLNEVDGAGAHAEVESLPPTLRRRITAKRDQYESTVRSIVASGVRRREFRSCDPALVTRALLGALNWTSRWYRPEGRLTARALADEFGDYLTRGLTR